MPRALYEKTLLLIAVGRLQEGADLIKRLEPAVTEGRLPTSLHLWAQYVLALEQEDRRASEAMLGRILKMVNDPQTSFEDLVNVNFSVVPFLCRHSRTDIALQILGRSVAAGAVPTYDWLMLSPHLEPVRKDARFQKILSHSRAKFDEMVRILEDARARGELPKYLEKPLTDLLTQLAIPSAKARRTG